LAVEVAEGCKIKTRLTISASAESNCEGNSMKSWPKILALTALLSTLFLAGCEKSGLLAGYSVPDTIQVYLDYPAAPIVITNEEQIKGILSYFTGTQKRWRYYWDTIPGTGIKVDFEKNGKWVAGAFIGSNWAIVEANENYSTDITQQEHDNLFQFLGVKKN
jgi:hypothetical protein